MEGRIKIGSNPIVQLESLGLYIEESDKYFAAPQTEMEEQFFPELGRSFIHPVTYDKPFDFKLKLGAKGDVNTIVSKFYSDVKGKVIEFYNDYSKIKIVGYIKSPTLQDKFAEGISTFPITIRVNDPSKCNFKL